MAVCGCSHMAVFMAGATTTGRLKSQARAMQVTRLSARPWASLARVFALRGAMTSTSAQRRSVMCSTGSPLAVQTDHSSSSPYTGALSSCSCCWHLRKWSARWEATTRTLAPHVPCRLFTSWSALMLATEPVRHSSTWGSRPGCSALAMLTTPPPPPPPSGVPPGAPARASPCRGWPCASPASAGGHRRRGTRCQ